MVPLPAAALAVVLSFDAQIQVIDPVLGMVDPVVVPANAVPAAVEPSTGVNIRVAPP